MIQKTVKIETEKGTEIIKMKLRTVTRCGNIQGKRVKVNEKDYYIFTLDNEYAFRKAYSQYIKELN